MTNAATPAGVSHVKPGMKLLKSPAGLCLSVLIAMLSVTHEPAAQQATRPARGEVLVLGVYHMANPGRDVVNMQADDVLAPGRQGEIAELIAVLSKFNPTKIAVEEAFSSRDIHQRYADYVAGKRNLTRNETEQIGFRLANELGHKTVHPVDVTGEFPHLRVVGYAKAHGRSAEFDSLMAQAQELVETQQAYLASHTVLETLRYMNSDDQVAKDVGLYYQQAHFGGPWDWAGADLVSEWFRRNMRIYSNVVQLVESPAERVLVIYGAGHLGWLRHNVASDPTLRLRKLEDLVR